MLKSLPWEAASESCEVGWGVNVFCLDSSRIRFFRGVAPCIDTLAALLRTLSESSEACGELVGRGEKERRVCRFTEPRVTTIAARVLAQTMFLCLLLPFSDLESQLVSELRPFSCFKAHSSLSK